MVTDPGGLSATSDVTIYLTDINDNPPAFNQTSYDFKVGDGENVVERDSTDDVNDKKKDQPWPLTSWLQEHVDIVSSLQRTRHYTGNEANINVESVIDDCHDWRHRLPGLCLQRVGLSSAKGDLVGAIGVTDPDAGSNARTDLVMTSDSPSG
ncbi:hypothetical protein C0Q70_07888 [Pomacea canaliculata]|uniref:Cadherin domain-containing protein n=1 Tax=Pomacea canaliculata TaxID=400727 RepID=A0A2T7PGG6_POMCA|nr:hypothetical protein C0Q70_07888 [Pomacea canaliculata]